MPYDLQNRLVIGVASSAVFDLKESDSVFQQKGEEKYRLYQKENLYKPLPKGIAYPFIRRMLELNSLQSPDDPLVEVILLSRNDPDTGLRVMETIKHYGLNITRAIFTQGKAPYEYIKALNISLFLSGNASDVKTAIEASFPAGLVLDSKFVDDEEDYVLRIAFDFDGVIASDESEAIFAQRGLDGFQDHEVQNVLTPHNPGPLKDFLVKINRIQNLEETRKRTDKHYQNRLRVSLVTARNAPAHERAIKTLEDWGVRLNDAFFLGGINKGCILEVLKPHIYFEDQISHIEKAQQFVPAVHIPFGVRNQESAQIPEPN
ncbi:5'-nucleotidase [Brackiella oedipodis]|uniref:5'-nucleotidase n=1 Tax=Brackiella oedipodis TaxID=124225 RepID=UPI00048FC0E6|nr:5'-nucleotidase [Brackiella oedipodis]